VSSVHHECTNHLFDTGTSRRLDKHKRPKQVQTEAEQAQTAQTSPNKNEQSNEQDQAVGTSTSTNNPRQAQAKANKCNQVPGPNKSEWEQMKAGEKQPLAVAAAAGCERVHTNDGASIREYGQQTGGSKRTQMRFFT
jgi:hypothetical protein